MLTSLRLGNFKAFAEAQQLPLKPLTLIFGANSAGKSSLIHGLILAHEANRTGTLDVHRTELGGESVDLGGFRQYVHRREANRRVEWTVELGVAHLTGRLAELLAPVQRAGLSLAIGLELNDQGEPAAGAFPVVTSYEISADGSRLLDSSRRSGGYLQLDHLEHEHPVFREIIKAIVQMTTTTETLTAADFEGLDDTIAELVPELTIDSGRFLPTGLAKTEKRADPSEQQMLFPVSQGRRQEDLAAAVRFFLPPAVDELIRGLSEAVTKELGHLHYLGPLRSYPPRHLAFTQHHDPNRFAGGGYAWDVVREDETVREKVNTWLGDKNKLSTPYELQIRHLLTIDDLEGDYSNRIEQLERRFTEEKYDWDLFYEIQNTLNMLRSKESLISNLKELVLIDKRTNTNVSHRDVGIGVSQVLPVLVTAFASKEQILAIEQPEIHLHPALQAELGDVFIESALGERRNTFILETHSEHIILRILKRIRQTTANPNKDTPQIRPNDVALLYIEPSNSGSSVKEIRIDERGRLIDRVPGGFFEEDFAELF